MQFGTIVDWRVKPGDAVTRGDVVALVETEKGVIEVEIFESGVIESLVVQPGRKVPVGTTLATLSGDGKKVERQPAAKAAVALPTTAAPPKDEIVPAQVAAPVAEESLRLRVSPLARKRAQELGLDLSTITGTGGEGSITIADVERAAESAKTITSATAPVASKGLDLTAMRRVIATAVGNSVSTVWPDAVRQSRGWDCLVRGGCDGIGELVEHSRVMMLGDMVDVPQVIRVRVQSSGSAGRIGQ